MYARGQGVPQNYAEAVRWYRLAAEQGNAPAQNNLGVMYAKGEGVPQDYVQAHKWANLAAANQADPERRKNSDELRDMVASRMTPAQIDRAQQLAAEWRPKIEQPANLVPETPASPERKPVPKKSAPPKAEPGNPIAATQEALRQLGYDPGPADGVVGPKTREAVKKFERDHGMPETGEITPQLIERMSKAFYEQT
jgi:hypothetical protein